MTADPRETMTRVAERAAIDRATFEQEIVPAARPVVLRGQVAAWPVVTAATRSDEAMVAHLEAHANDEPIEAWFAPFEAAGRFDFADDRTTHNHVRRRAPLKVLLRFLLAQRGVTQPEAAYAGAIPLARHLPGLRAECAMPLLDADRATLVSLWVGNRTRTAAHWDLPQNLACVVAGRRRFTLFPPEQVGNLYVGAVDVTLAGQPSSLVDVTDPDLARFPRFSEAVAAGMVADLAPGDVLYVPSLWWHHVEACDAIGAMINFWWRDGPEGRPSPLQTLYHALLTLRDLPKAERMAWRAFFDHYIFQTGGDPWAHLPEAARGVFGPLTEESVAALKVHLAGALGRR